jgi:hypothetical protein
MRENTRKYEKIRENARKCEKILSCALKKTYKQSEQKQTQNTSKQTLLYSSYTTNLFFYPTRPYSSGDDAALEQTDGCFLRVNQVAQLGVAPLLRGYFRPVPSILREVGFSRPRSNILCGLLRQSCKYICRKHIAMVGFLRMWPTTSQWAACDLIRVMRVMWVRLVHCFLITLSNLCAIHECAIFRGAVASVLFLEEL